MAAKELALVAKTKVAQGTMAFRFQRQDVRFQAGQSADFTLDVDGKPLTHTFSISSSPENPETLMITTRMRDTPFKHALERLEPGDKIRVQDPNGNFQLPAGGEPVVFVTGGIGITPARSMLKHMVDTGDRRRFVLFYSNPTRSEAAFLDELEEWSRRLALDLVVTVTREDPGPGWRHGTGRIDGTMLRQHLDEELLEKAVFCIAGPPGMVEELAKTVKALGVPDDRVKTDDFTGY
jgi:ferredoxin-NADP reductase